jgi:hypothetical protein
MRIGITAGINIDDGIDDRLWDLGAGWAVEVNYWMAVHYTLEEGNWLRTAVFIGREVGLDRKVRNYRRPSETARYYGEVRDFTNPA